MKARRCLHRTPAGRAQRVIQTAQSAVPLPFAVAVRFRDPLWPHRALAEHRGWRATMARQGTVRPWMACRCRPRARPTRRELRAAECGLRGVLSLGYFSLHKQREVTRASARKKKLDQELHVENESTARRQRAAWMIRCARPSSRPAGVRSQTQRFTQLRNVFTRSISPAFAATAPGGGSGTRSTS